MRLASAPLSTALANLIARLTASHTSASFLVPKSSTAVPVLMTDQTKPSPELLAVVRRWLEAMRTRQADSYIHLFSSTENLRYIGTDADEVWGGEVFRNGFIDHVNEIPDWWFEETRAEAFERGEVGWAFLEGKILVDGAQKTNDRPIHPCLRD